MRHYIWTVGCQMNVADSEQMAAALAEMGSVAASEPQEADIIVLNTCSVRQAAENRAFGKLTALRSLKKQRPDLIVALAGCMVGDDSLSYLHRRLPFVDAFIRPADVASLCETVRTLSPSGSAIRHRAAETCLSDTSDDANATESRRREDIDLRSAPVRWLPIIHGCNRACSYCIVPARRGRERSRPVSDIVAEAGAMVAAGAREVRLLGQIVDRYGWDLPEKVDLGVLFRRLSGIEELCRIRFLTSHPRDLRPGTIKAIAEVPQVCEDINIPVQAGDDAILKSMRRGYTIRYYHELIARLRREIPRVAISTDVIVGYPGETADQFRRTLDVLAEIQFDVVHVAMYSPRAGTAAARMPDDVAPQEKKERLRQVEELQEAIAATINGRLAGQTLEILVEKQNKSAWEGRTRTNKPVFFHDSGDWLGKLARVRIERAGAWSLSGRLADEESSA